MTHRAFIMALWFDLIVCACHCLHFGAPILHDEIFVRNEWIITRIQIALIRTWTRIRPVQMISWDLGEIKLGRFAERFEAAKIRAILLVLVSRAPYTMLKCKGINSFLKCGLGKILKAGLRFVQFIFLHIFRCKNFKVANIYEWP